MKRTTFVALVLTTFGSWIPIKAHETDQFTVPVGREFADLRFYFSDDCRERIADGVEVTNRRIKRSLRRGQPTPQTQRLQTPEVIARAVWSEFPPVITQIEATDSKLLGRTMKRRFPGLVVAWQPATWIYHHWGLVFDPTKLVRLKRSSTVMVDGVYFGTDKLAHFIHMGYIYYGAYRAAKGGGSDEAEATRRAVALGAGHHLFFSENALLGLLTTGVRSNADLAANYVGMKFFQNLTDPVRIKGRTLPPLLVRDGLYWRLADRVVNDADFFADYITDHWDEALNANEYGVGISTPVRAAIQARCGDVLDWYRGADGRQRTRDEFAALAEELQTYYGEDYGHDGDISRLVNIASVCFENPAMLASAPGDGASGGSNRTLAAQIQPDNAFGRSSLWNAVRDGSAERVAQQLSSGADTNTTDIDGETVLHVAARRGDVAVMRVLLDHGAEVNVSSRQGLSPLHLAAREGHTEAANLLLDRGADVNARDVFGCTPLHDLAARGDSELARAFLLRGAAVGARDLHGTTPLHRAARAGMSELVAALRTQGADPTAANDFGRTPLDEALAAGHRELADQLRAAQSGTPRTAAVIESRATTK